MKNGVIALGILGCARNIPVSVIHPLTRVPEIRLAGIAGRSRERAEEAAARFGVPRAFPSYDALLESGDIDVVYVMLPNSLHAAWAVKAMRRGKHVLVEKPACLSAAECDDMKSAAGESRLTLMEAVMAAHHPWQDHVRRIVDEGRLGKLREVRTSISFIPKDNFSGNYRSLPDMGGGVFFDLASYWLQLAQKLVPVAGAAVTGSSAFAGPHGCDWSFHASLATADGVVSRFEGSFEKPYRAGHEIVFEAGAVEIHNVFGANIGRHKLKINIRDDARGTVETRDFEPQNYYENQLRFLADVIQGRRDAFPLEEIRERVDLMERIYASARSAAANAAGKPAPP